MTSRLDAVTTRFDADTAVEPRGHGVYAARIDPGWWVGVGPNGGYLAAILLRALAHTVDDPGRAPRSLALHYTNRPAPGPVSVETRVERAGRSLTTLTGRLLQDGRLLTLALAAFSKPRTRGLAHDQTRMPEVPAPEQCPPMDPRIEMHHRYEQRWAVGPQSFTRSERALAGGWIRLAEPRLLDAPLAAAFSDSFPPAIFATLAGPGDTEGIPTVDLSVHFRDALPRPGASPGDWSLAVFRSHLARDGFVEEDGELWSADGRLLLQSRQLALAR